MKPPIASAAAGNRHGRYEGYAGQFHYVLSLENIEHLLDDRKLMHDLAACLKRGGWLVLIGWLVMLPFRILPLIVDPVIRKLTKYSDYSITMVAYKPRFV